MEARITNVTTTGCEEYCPNLQAVRPEHRRDFLFNCVTKGIIIICPGITDKSEPCPLPDETQVNIRGNISAYDPHSSPSRQGWVACSGSLSSKI